VFHIHSLDRLRAEGLVDVQYLAPLRLALQQKKLRAVIEYSQPLSHDPALKGHLDEVAAVAVSKDNPPLIVAGGADGTAIAWEYRRSSDDRREKFRLPHPAPIRAIACTGKGAAGNWCVTAAADGKARIWDLHRIGKDRPEPIRELYAENGHRGALTCVAFNPDGTRCVTGGEDKDICLWDTQTGNLLGKFPSVHRGAITALQFAQANQVVSAARDNTLAFWQVDGSQAQLLRRPIGGRSGDVTILGVSPDGKRVLFDQGRILQLLKVPEGRPESDLQNAAAGANFTTFALFSPDGRTILCASSGGRLQLWRAPDQQSRGFEMHQLVSPERSTCAAFAPDGSFIVTGTRERQVLIWPVATGDGRLAGLHQAQVSLVDSDVQGGARQVRVWAELDNPDRMLPPGTTVTMVLYHQ
jgi:WD40 repeat protein